MNRSATRAHAANAPGLWTRVRQLLHAFAEVGQPSSAALQLLLGPNGSLMWTDSAQVDRSEPYADIVLAIPEKSTAPVDQQSPVITRPEEPAGSPVYAPLEASAHN